VQSHYLTQSGTADCDVIQCHHVIRDSEWRSLREAANGHNQLAHIGALTANKD
jgi:hypothetical protein